MRQKLLFISCWAIAGLFQSCDNAQKAEYTKTIRVDSLHSASVDSLNTIAESKEDSADSVSEEVEAERIVSLASLGKRLNKKASYFIIKTNRDTVIRCKEGTLLSIPANAFLSVADPSSVVGEVKIAVKEFYKLSDMLIGGLTTSSNGQLLETGGMINLKITGKKNNDSLVLKPGKNIVMAMPNSAGDNVDRMQLFNGTHDSAIVDWVPRNGVGGMAQRWRTRQNNFPYNPYPTLNEFIFPEGPVKNKPQIINTEPENLKTELKVTLRDLTQQTGTITKKASAYIDTSGNLHCYKVGNGKTDIIFRELYSTTVYQGVKVNLGVDVSLSFTHKINQVYYQKLLKMGKGNPDSIITVVATLNPGLKLNSFEKVRVSFKNIVSVREYQRKLKIRQKYQLEYQAKLKQLRLDTEERLSKNATSSLAGAQDYLLLSTPKLGWINCDRFYDKADKIEYFVKLKEPASVLIVFNSIKAILSSNANGAFPNVPLNEKITIVGLKTEEGKLMMAMHETTITQAPFEALSFKQVTIKEYKSRLEQLNRL